MTNTKLLEELIRESGLRLGFIAEKLGISRQALYKKIKGLVSFNQNEIKMLCELLHITKWSVIKAVFFAENVDELVHKVV